MSYKLSKIIISAAALFALSTAVGAFLLQHYFREDLTATTLRDGRMVLTPGAYIFHASDPGRNGSPLNIQDGVPDTAAVIPYPAPHPQGTWFLIDAGLSHWPPIAPGGVPQARQPRALILHNGICSSCPPAVFHSYSRMRRVRIEFLERRANNPDREFKHENWRVTYTRNLQLPDRPGPVRIGLDLPSATASPGYPKNVFFLACKITILDTYPGRKFRDRVALAEFTYLDGPDPALRISGGEHTWK